MSSIDHTRTQDRDAAQCPTPEEPGRPAAGAPVPAKTMTPAQAEAARRWHESAVKPTRGRRLFDISMTIAALLFLVLGVDLWFRASAPVRAAKKAGHGSSATAGWILTPTPGAMLSEAPRRFEIQGAPPGTFEVQILSPDSQVVWRSPARPEPWVEVPEEVRAGLEPGVRYAWRVFLDDGSLRRSPPETSFVIKRP